MRGVGGQRSSPATKHKKRTGRRKRKLNKGKPGSDIREEGKVPLIPYKSNKIIYTWSALNSTACINQHSKRKIHFIVDWKRDRYRKTA